jgi:hypothetical protein
MKMRHSEQDPLRHSLGLCPAESLALNPSSANAHCRLADTLDEIKEHEATRPHWKADLREEGGAWAESARRRLADRA